MRTAVLTYALLLLPLSAQAGPKAPAASKAPPEVQAEGKVKIGEHQVPYRVKAGELALADEAGKPHARVFRVEYTRRPKLPRDKRPLTFAFNGGPGSSAVWLHLGALGPKRVRMGDAEGMPGKPPYKLVPNAHSWLDFTDLVFVDPVSTGFSRPAKGVKRSLFHGINEDVDYLARWIRLYLTQTKRWGSPIYLAGESYGTTRVVGLARALQERHGIELSGLVLISPVLSFQTIRFGSGNDLPYWLYLPTYAATAHYHRRLAPDLQRKSVKALLKEVERFARSEYVLALAQGDALSPRVQALVARKIARYTGLSASYVLAARLRIPIFRFTKQLLRAQGKSVGRLDSRYLGVDRDPTSDRYDYDPSYAAIQGPYTACLNDYLGRELGYQDRRAYRILTGKVHPWSYKRFQNRYVNVSESLRRVMSRNKHLRVLSCSGYYDLATPHFAMNYTWAHMGLTAGQRRRVQQTHYQAGHMMYLRLVDLAALRKHAAAFYTPQAPRVSPKPKPSQPKPGQPKPGKVPQDY